MKKYENTSGYVTGTYPNTLAKNSSTGVSTDGTPWVQDYVNAHWALVQALSHRVGQTWSGTVEAYTAVGSGSAAGLGQTINDPAQQQFRALAANFGAAGELVFDVINASVTDRRVVQPQGQVLDGFLYPDLVYSTWVGAGANGAATGFYTTSDAGGTTRSAAGLTINGITSGRYLVLPDYRGLSPIMMGTNGKTAIAYAGATTLNAYLADQMQGHIHIETAQSAGGSLLTVQALLAGGGQANTNNTTTIPVTDGTNGTPRTGLYTRTPGFACNCGLRY